MALGKLISMTSTLLMLMTSQPCSCSPASDHADPSEPSLQRNPNVRNVHFDYPVGDPRRCQQQAMQTKLDMMRFEVLPGVGWDNLQNKEMGMVVRYNYSLCKVTDDGRYLIPDDVIALPIKSSYVETFAEMIDNYLNSTSTTANSVNVQAGLSLKLFAASGSFSWEHQRIKSKQIEDHAVTTRVQLRYKRYDAKLQPQPELDPKFKDRLLSIAGNLLLNKTEQAIYEGELLVRDYGTHVLTSVMAGAGLVKTDFIKKKFIGTSDFEKTDVLAEASASFLSIFHASASYKHSSSKSVSTKYNKSLTHSYVTTHGGPLLGANTSLSVWVDGVDLNLVPMDRSGDPLYFLITPTMFPELPVPTVAALEKIVRNSIEMYYEMNTIRGCTKLSSPNFSQSANFDDGTCESKPTNLTFGGVFQTCAITSGRFLHDDPCKNMVQVNPSTGKHSCPTGYTAVETFTGTKTSAAESQRSCHRCYLLFHCCHTDQYRATATYKTYWCAATGPVRKDSGYIFGGFYSTHMENPLTGDHSCGAKFYALRMFTDLHICLSDEYESVIGIPFGGLFSCQQGNPLALPGVHPVGANEKLQAPKPNSLRSFFAGSNAGQPKEAGPKTCPKGYSQHVAVVEQGCAIHYCTLTGALAGPMLPPVKRPPFSREPAALIEEKDNLVMFNLQDQTWYKDEDARRTLQKLNPSSPVVGPQGGGESGGLSAGTAAGVAVMATLAFVIGIVVIGLVVAKRQKRKRQQAYHRLPNQETDEQRSLYGSDRNDVIPEARVNPEQTSSVSV